MSGLRSASNERSKLALLHHPRCEDQKHLVEGPQPSPALGNSVASVPKWGIYHGFITISWPVLWGQWSSKHFETISLSGMKYFIFSQRHVSCDRCFCPCASDLACRVGAGRGWCSWAICSNGKTWKERSGGDHRLDQTGSEHFWGFLKWEDPQVTMGFNMFQC